MLEVVVMDMPIPIWEAVVVVLELLVMMQVLQVL
jgi:hypothetical protein